MIIPPGMVDVILSDKLTTQEKVDAIIKFSWPVVHVGGPNAGLVEAGAMPEEDAWLICAAVEKGHYQVTMVAGQPMLNFYFNKEDLK